MAAAANVLRLARNSRSHLERIPEADADGRSRELTRALDVLLTGVEFISSVPLVHVLDYTVDGLTGNRAAVFEYLQGSGVVFPHGTQEVRSEVARGSIGLLVRSGEFFDLTPWIVLHTCEMCKRPEVFLFSRWELGFTTYVAMESGHPWKTESTSRAVSRLVELEPVHKGELQTPVAPHSEGL